MSQHLNESENTVIKVPNLKKTFIHGRGVWDDRETGKKVTGLVLDFFTFL